MPSSRPFSSKCTVWLAQGSRQIAETRQPRGRISDWSPFYRMSPTEMLRPTDLLTMDGAIVVAEQHFGLIR